MQSFTLNYTNNEDWIKNLDQQTIINYIKLGKYISDNVLMKLRIDHTDDPLIGDMKTIFTDKIDELTKNVDAKLFKYNENSQKKGEYNQSLVEEIYNKWFKDAVFEDKSKEPHCGDAWIKSDTIPLTLVELKHYTNAVPTKEVEKFKQDMNNTGITYGLFIATGNITKKPKCISCENMADKTLVYVPNADEPSIIAGTLMIKHIHMNRCDNGNNSTKNENIIRMIKSKIPQIKDKINTIETYREKIKTKKKALNDTLDEIDEEMKAFNLDFVSFINGIESDIQFLM